MRFKRLSKRHVVSILVAGVYLCFGGLLFAADELAVPPEVVGQQTAAADLEQSGDLAGAQAEYEKIIQAFPHTPHGLEACAQSGRLSIQQKQYAELQPVVEQICTNFQDQPRIFRVLSGLAKDCMYAEAYPEALSVCTEAQSRLLSHPRATLITGWLGMIYAHQGDFEGAAQMRQSLLQNANCTGSDFLDAMCDIGWGYYCAGEWDEALETYQQGLARHPEHKSAVYLQYQTVKTHLAREDMEAAGREMDVLLTQYGHREQTPGLACRLAKDYRKQKNFDGAIQVYKKVLERFGNNEIAPSVRDAIVETYADAGDLGNALTALQTDIEQCPHRRELLRMITRVAVETARGGNTDTAMDLVDAIFEQNPEGADQQLFGYTTRARVYVHQNKDAEAAAAVDEALERFKDSPDALAYHLFGVGEEYYVRGEKLLQQGNEEQAQANFMKAIAMWKKNIDKIGESHHQASAYFYSGAAYAYLQDYSKAAEYMGITIEKWPDYKYASDAQLLKTRYLELIDSGGKLSISKDPFPIEDDYENLN